MNKYTSFNCCNSQKNRPATGYNNSGVFSNRFSPNPILIEKRAQASQSIQDRKLAWQGIKNEKLPKFLGF